TGPEDRVTLIAAGVTVPEALAAADRLAAAGVPARGIDLYSIKPVDTATLRRAAAETGQLVTVEDHWPEGGLGDAALEALTDDGPLRRVRKLAVRTMPASATPAGQRRAAGLDAGSIAEGALALIAG